MIVGAMMIVALRALGALGTLGALGALGALADPELNVATPFRPLANLTPPDTSVIILSSLIPSHPATGIIEDVFASVTFLDGLPANAPIYISVDGLPTKYYTEENVHILHEYIRNLRARFLDDQRVTILNNYEHGHISNSIKLALEVVRTEFIYVLQHDLSFVKHVNHMALVDAFHELKEIQIVRFGLKHPGSYPIPAGALRSPGCQGMVRVHSTKSSGLHFHLVKWSDNNHFTRKTYYQKLLAGIGPTKRAPESPMMHRGGLPQALTLNATECSFVYQYLYNPTKSPFLKHLDGRANSARLSPG